MQNILAVMPTRFGNETPVGSQSERGVTENSEILDSVNRVVEEGDRIDHIQDTLRR